MVSAWRPIHRSLNDEAMEIVATNPSPVHLALTTDDVPQPFRTACSESAVAAWGQWITGDIKQVTCAPCIEQVHA